MKQGEENGSGERARAVDRYLHTGSFEAFRSTFLSGLVLAFFGIGFYRLWYQFNFYNLHFSADVGMVTVGARAGREDGMGKAPGVDALYESDPFRTGAVHALIAFFLYALLLGMALGYPDGRHRELSQTVRSIHQVLVVLLIAFVVWLVLVRERSFKLSGYWLFQNALMMASICFLMSGSSGSEEASTFLLTNAVTCFYIPLVFFICLIGRHVHYQTTLVYAVVYGGSLLCMAVGRIIVYAVGPTLDHSLWLLIVMAIVVLVEATLIMRPRFMGDYPIGFELGTMRNEASEGAAEVGVVDPVAAFAGLYGLSDVERDIVSLISQGRSRSFIAQTLNYSENTIRNYTRTVYRKVGVHSKQELLDRVADARE